MDRLVMGGIGLSLLGLIGFAIPIFTTQKTEEVAHIGDLTIQSTQHTSHTISPILSGGAVAFGVLLIGAGLYRKR